MEEFVATSSLVSLKMWLEHSKQYLFSSANQVIRLKRLTKSHNQMRLERVFLEASRTYRIQCMCQNDYLLMKRVSGITILEHMYMGFFYIYEFFLLLRSTFPCSNFIIEDQLEARDAAQRNG